LLLVQAGKRPFMILMDPARSPEWVVCVSMRRPIAADCAELRQRDTFDVGVRLPIASGAAGTDIRTACTQERLAL
jgi:hypothetical protein